MSERDRSQGYPPQPLPDPARVPLFNLPGPTRLTWARPARPPASPVGPSEARSVWPSARADAPTPTVPVTPGDAGVDGAGGRDVDGAPSRPSPAGSGTAWGTGQLGDLGRPDLLCGPWHVPEGTGPHGPHEPDRADWQLVRELRLEATNRLADAMNAEGLDAVGRQQRGRSVIADVVRQRVKADIDAGREPWSERYRGWLRTALDDTLFRLGRLQPLLERDDIENIIIVGHAGVWLDLVDGSLERAQPVADSDEELVEFLRFVANRFQPRGNERPFNEAVPKLHLSLSWDGEGGRAGRARLAATAFVTARPSVLIRRHRLTSVTLEDLVGRGMLSHTAAGFLRACVRAGKSIVVSGPQGAGKTTFIRALCACLDPSEKIGTFETEYELFLHEMPERHPIVHPWESRPGSSEVDAFGRRAGEFTLDEAITDSFRFFLSRQIVGEVRGSEIWAMIKAMESGAGSISSTHGRDARATIAKLVTCAMEAGQSHDLATAKLAQTIDVVVQLGLLTEPDGEDRFTRTRWVSEIVTVEPGDAGINLDHVFRADPGTTVAVAAGGAKNAMLTDLEAAGLDLSAFRGELLARGVQPA